MEIQMGEGSLNLEILREGGHKQFLKFRWKGGGSKNRAFSRGGVDLFWNNPMFTKFMIYYFSGLLFFIDA